MIALIRLPDGTFQLLNGRRVQSREGHDDPIPSEWRMEIRPYDWADQQEWGHLPKGPCFLVPTGDLSFTRARVLSEAEVTITEAEVTITDLSRPAKAERRTA